MLHALFVSLATCASQPLASNQVLPIVSSRGNVTATAFLLDKWTALTAGHAVGPERTVVFLKCGDEDVAGVVSRRGKVQDLALITLYQACHDVAPVQISESDVEAGDEVSFVGYPAGRLTAGTGKVRGFAMFGVKDRVAGGGLFWIGLMIDGDVRPGNSGGPIFTKSGKLCAIVHGFHETTEGKPGVGVALPAILEFLKHAYEDPN